MIVKIEDGTISIQPDKIDTKFIAKNKVSIFGLVLPFFIMLCILWYKENARLTTVEKTFIVVVLLTQICTLYTCTILVLDTTYMVSRGSLFCSKADPI